jgi:hypothetical protein
MRHTGRVLSFGALAVLFLALPTAGLAGPPKDLLREPGSGPQVTLPGGNAVVPTLVPGASVRTLGLSDAVAYSPSAGATVVTTYLPASDLDYEYNSQGNYSILASLGLPAGATLWQIDVYGYTTGATTQHWGVYDQTGSGSFSLPTTMTMDTSTGPGLVHAALTFPSGVTLGAGHEWFVDLFVTSSSSGFVGAYVQYTLPTLSLVPMTPVRVFDSRFSSRIVQGAPRTINVKDAINVGTGVVTTPNAIPKGARAISFTITATGTGAAGYVAVLPGTSTAVTASTINWTGPGATLATGGIVSLGSGAAERQVTLVVGGGGSASTDVIVDITGYFK